MTGRSLPCWRAMAAADMLSVSAVATQVHPGYPEDEAVFAERLALSAEGCFCLEDAGRVSGYVLSHPWPLGAVPALNRLLGAIPLKADAYYLHDLALLPQARGTGMAAAIVRILARHARERGFTVMALVAVGDSLGFWHRLGFRVAHDAALADKLASYDDAARYMTRDLEI